MNDRRRPWLSDLPECLWFIAVWTACSFSVKAAVACRGGGTFGEASLHRVSDANAFVIFQNACGYGCVELKLQWLAGAKGYSGRPARN